MIICRVFRYNWLGLVERHQGMFTVQMRKKCFVDKSQTYSGTWITCEVYLALRKEPRKTDVSRAFSSLVLLVRLSQLLFDCDGRSSNSPLLGSVEHGSSSGLMWNIALDGNGNPKLPGTNSCGGPGCRGVVQINNDGSWSVNQECRSPDY